MSKKNKQENEKEYGIVSWVGLVLSRISVVIAVWTISASNTNAKTDRRVDTYTEAMVSLDTLAFYEWSAENGYEEIVNNEIDNEWMRKQLLEAVKIKARLELFDEKKADKYWNIISQIFDEGHKFDTNEYEKLKKEIKEEI